MKQFAGLYLSTIVFSLNLIAQEPIRKQHFNLTDGVAMQGYDPVAYFRQQQAVKGKRDIAFYHQGATYYFSSPGNREIFKANTTLYEPEYGGWCAYAMGATGEKVSINPSTFKIVNGKLYLFYNKYFTNTLKDWNKNEPGLKSSADANWRKLFH